MIVATIASPVTLRTVRSMSSGRSTARISASPSTGSPTAFRTMISITMPAPGTPAVPMEARVAVTMIVSCWASVSSMPNTWAMKTAATA
ncbi:MAG: hypothetical protein BWX64_02351 [Acidobacteria bacterium ADurb.Bin051]|nr:MAG: hypothetical protein BWX64_02351 [Acidobacteria bacterium ADurb.Bin051]